MRRRRVIKRKRDQGDVVSDTKPAWNAKVEARYRRLQKPLRLRGLWNWRKCAAALHLAGIGVQSGTVPVERLWFSTDQFWPEMARDMHKDWWSLLSH